jgi:VWFA-related protein
VRRGTAVLLLAAAAAPGALAQQPTFPSGVELITVDVVVVDGKGRPVRGLTREEFVVEEDGRPQEIASFEAVAAPEEPAPAPAAAPIPTGPASNERRSPDGGRAFALVFDDVGMTSPEAVEARQAVATLLERSLRPGDEVSLGTTSGDTWWSARLPEGREDLLAVTGRLKGRLVESINETDYMSDYEAFWVNNRETQSGGRIIGRVLTRWEKALVCDPRARMQCEGVARARATSIDGARRLRARAALAAVRRGIEALSPVRGRKTLLLWSRGFLEDAETEVREVVGVSREANTAVYFLDVRGLMAAAPGVSAADRGNPDPQEAGAMRFEAGVLESAGSQALAEDTGGRSVRNTNDLAGAADGVAGESRVFYLLGLHPPPGKGPREWRKLNVRVTRPGLEVRARRGYTVPAPPGADAGKGREAERKSDAVPRGLVGVLDSAHAAPGIPVRAMAYVLEPRPRDVVRVLVVAEFDARALKLDARGKEALGRVDMSVAATPRDGGRTHLSGGRIEVRVREGDTAGWRSFSREFEMPPGVAQARVALKDPAGGAVGAVSHRFEVPPAGAFRLSTPILTDRAEGGKDGRPVQPALAVHRVFPPAGRLYCQYEVFGAARPSGQALPQVAAGLELRGADGRVLLKAPPTRVSADPDGRLVRLVGIPVDGLPGGAYDIVLEVRDEVSGAQVQRRESFVIGAGGGG